MDLNHDWIVVAESIKLLNLNLNLVVTSILNGYFWRVYVETNETSSKKIQFLFSNHAINCHVYHRSLRDIFLLSQ